MIDCQGCGLVFNESSYVEVRQYQLHCCVRSQGTPKAHQFDEGECLWCGVTEGVKR